MLQAVCLVYLACLLYLACLFPSLPVLESCSKSDGLLDSACFLFLLVSTPHLYSSPTCVCKGVRRSRVRLEHPALFGEGREMRCDDDDVNDLHGLGFQREFSLGCCLCGMLLVEKAGREVAFSGRFGRNSDGHAVMISYLGFGIVYAVCKWLSSTRRDAVLGLRDRQVHFEVAVN